MKRIVPLTILLLILGIAIGLLLASKVKAECHEIPITSWSPTGIAGCEIYGTGLASWWNGPGIAVNSCVWPWTACPPLRITLSETGRSITVTPTMFCDCYTGTSDQRIVDLDPSALKALGLDPSKGLYRVSVQPAFQLPDTALPSSS